MDGKSGDNLKDVNPAASLRGDDLGVSLDLLILTLGKVKSDSSGKQQRIEKQVHGSSTASFPMTLSDVVTRG